MIKYNYAQICDLLRHGFEPEGYDIIYRGLKPGLVIDETVNVNGFEIKMDDVPVPESIHIKGKIDVMDRIYGGMPSHYLKQEKMDFGTVTVQTAFVVEKLELNYHKDRIPAVNEWFTGNYKKKSDIVFDITVRVKGFDIDIYNVMPTVVNYPQLDYDEGKTDMAVVETVNDFVHLNVK